MCTVLLPSRVNPTAVKDISYHIMLCHVMLCHVMSCHVISYIIHEDISKRLKSGNACYHSVQNLLPSSFIPKNIKIKIYRTIILSCVLYGFEIWSLTMRGET